MSEDKFCPFCEKAIYTSWWCSNCQMTIADARRRRSEKHLTVGEIVTLFVLVASVVGPLLLGVFLWRR